MEFKKELNEIIDAMAYHKHTLDAIENDMAKANSSTSKEISDDEAFIRSYEKNLGIRHTTRNRNTQTSCFSMEEQVEHMNFNEILDSIPKDIRNSSIEDLLTAEEIQKSDDELFEIYKSFSEKTELKKQDYYTMAVAISLQCLRQYILDPWLKKHRNGSSVKDEKAKKNAEAGWYRVETTDILTHRVPFDAQDYYKNNRSIQGFLKGASDHRYVTLGHDPVLGWVFGTANIMTNTLTRFDLKSAHVKQVNNKNIIYSAADTGTVFNTIFERVSNEGVDGGLALACALIREGMHLKSDIKTKDSVPIPFVSAFSPKVAETLHKYGIDTASVGTEMTLSILINQIIAMVHRLQFDDKVEELNNFAVRTRKILLYSNLVASSSNIVAAVCTNNAKFMDVGGSLVTMIRMLSDMSYIASIEQEYVNNRLNASYEGVFDEIEDMYANCFKSK